MFVVALFLYGELSFCKWPTLSVSLSLSLLNPSIRSSFRARVHRHEIGRVHRHETEATLLKSLPGTYASILAVVVRRVLVRRRKANVTLSSKTNYVNDHLFHHFPVPFEPEPLLALLEMGQLPFQD